MSCSPTRISVGTEDLAQPRQRGRLRHAVELACVATGSAGWRRAARAAAHGRPRCKQRCPARRTTGRSRSSTQSPLPPGASHAGRGKSAPGHEVLAQRQAGDERAEQDQRRAPAPGAPACSAATASRPTNCRRGSPGRSATARTTRTRSSTLEYLSRPAVPIAVPAPVPAHHRVLTPRTPRTCGSQPSRCSSPSCVNTIVGPAPVSSRYTLPPSTARWRPSSISPCQNYLRSGACPPIGEATALAYRAKHINHPTRSHRTYRILVVRPSGRTEPPIRRLGA